MSTTLFDTLQCYGWLWRDRFFLLYESRPLPEYVVNCFLAAGYDVPEVVASMNTSEEPGNSIDLIEKYIHDHHSEDPNCRFYPLSDAGKPFRFPPGHRIRIQNFVYEQKQKKIVDIRVCRKRKVASSDNVSSCKKNWRTECIPISVLYRKYISILYYCCPLYLFCHCIVCIIYGLF